MEHISFYDFDGHQFFARTWTPEKPIAHIVIIHGAGEHVGRYEHVAARLVEAGYGVHAFDLRGHGRSSGKRFDLQDHFETYCNDIDHFLSQLWQDAGDEPKFLLGHSMGGSILARYAASREMPEIDGLVFSGPGLVAAGPGAVTLGRFLRWLGQKLPRLRLPAPPVFWISRDKSVVEAYKADPFVFHGPFTAELVANLSAGVLAAHADIPKITKPLLVVQGEKDMAADARGAEDLGSLSRSEDAKVIIYPGLYHEVMNEPEQGRVLNDIINWLDAHR